MHRLRLNDLRTRHASESALLAVRIPTSTVAQIRTLAKGLHVSVRDLVVALLNEGFDQYQTTRSTAIAKPLRRSRPYR